MTNRDLIKLFRLTSSLLELHGENPFKAKSYNSVVFQLENLQDQILELPTEEIGKLDGFSKGMVAKIEEIKANGTFTDLEQLLLDTPKGVVDMLSIKGLGPKKIRTLWKDSGIESKAELIDACEKGEVAKIKGFGKKTEEKILEAIAFEKEQEGKFLYAELESFMKQLEDELSDGSERFEWVGDWARKLPIIEEVEALVYATDRKAFKSKLEGLATVSWNKTLSSPYTLRGACTDIPLQLSVHFISDKADWVQKSIQKSSSDLHLSQQVNNTPLFEVLHSKKWNDVEGFYGELGLNTIPPEAREGLRELKAYQKGSNTNIVQHEDLKGILHNHSTYSDGKNTLKEMADYCKELGYEYLGISDHSQTAFYAGGLKEDEIIRQQEEIDQLNKDYAGFTIFKGIESDILNDGKLDYPDEVLKSFDFIVSSIHSNLGMDIDKATKRLLTAIENPYTTILGHPTGRLLLRREGYPIDHKKVIDACAANGVAIEINSNPWRLDLDWKWLDYALEKDLMLCTNPDAHETKGYHDMKYGVFMAQKVCVPKEKILNSFSTKELEDYFAKRK